MRHNVVFILLAAMGVAGCGKGPSLKTYPVTGTVTYNGKPLEGANVVYIGPNTDSPRSSAVTDSEGRFSLTTYVGPQELLKGAVPGEYKVTVTKLKAGAAAADDSSLGNMRNLSPEEQMKLMKQRMGGSTLAPGQTPTQKVEAGGPSATSEIPEKYGKPETSGFTATVVVGDNDPREFKLTGD